MISGSIFIILGENNNQKRKVRVKEFGSKKTEDIQKLMNDPLLGDDIEATYQKHYMS